MARKVKIMAKQRKWAIWWWDKNERRWFPIINSIYAGKIGQYFTWKEARLEATGRSEFFGVSRRRYRILTVGKRPGKR